MWVRARRCEWAVVNKGSGLHAWYLNANQKVCAWKRECAANATVFILVVLNLRIYLYSLYSWELVNLREAVVCWPALRCFFQPLLLCKACNFAGNVERILQVRLYNCLAAANVWTF